jgi:hypothetical protein
MSFTFDGLLCVVVMVGLIMAPAIIAALQPPRPPRGYEDDPD